MKNSPYEGGFHPPSRRHKHPHLECWACGDVITAMRFSTTKYREDDEIWDQFVGEPDLVLYFCSDDHREEWLYDMYCK